MPCGNACSLAVINVVLSHRDSNRMFGVFFCSKCTSDCLKKAASHAKQQRVDRNRRRKSKNINASKKRWHRICIIEICKLTGDDSAIRIKKAGSKRRPGQLAHVRSLSKFGFCWLAGLVEIYWPLNLKFYTLNSASRRFNPCWWPYGRHPWQGLASQFLPSMVFL